MTPTLLGRWQIRIFLLATVGLVISLIVGLLVRGTVPFYALLLVLLYVLLFGLAWDMIYQFITSYRWDRDWPTSFQVAAGIIEGALIWGLLATTGLPGITKPPPFYIFLIQYGIIWLSIFVLTQGPLRIIWLKWRYQGGQWFMAGGRQPATYGYQQPPAPAYQYPGAYPPQAPAAPQIIGGNYPPYPNPAPAMGGYPLQPTLAPPQVVRMGSPDPRQSLGDLAGLQPAQPYLCACGFAFDRSTGKFCPRCGRPKAQ